MFFLLSLSPPSFPQRARGVFFPGYIYLLIDTLPSLPQIIPPLLSTTYYALPFGRWLYHNTFTHTKHLTTSATTALCEPLYFSSRVWHRRGVSEIYSDNDNGRMTVRLHLRIAHCPRV